MLYLNTADLVKCGLNWCETVGVIEETVRLLHTNDYNQPIKPYLRYYDPVNRIIAMPAFVGGDIFAAGIKWIASFPGNLAIGMKRAHSVTILNDTSTGKALATINSALISGIRTASVSGLVVQYYDTIRNWNDGVVGIIGFGPIGQLHLEMLQDLFGDKINKFILYDIAGVNVNALSEDIRHKVVIAAHWVEAYEASDIVVTCTVSKHRYIDQPPKPGSLLLNVSLRDYKPDIINHTSSIIVDDWDEVCRENTDIEMLAKERGLTKDQTKSIVEMVCVAEKCRFAESDPIYFNPMGMAVFDIAVASYYYKKALSTGNGVRLDD
ncbi:2,3-diaminopropionate biosynthesis protein SbnB [Paenibacillus helianthi]|uniref:2,3-diaminopropionate biosynthesis protein SbnB n=1 Tax=Paenibacillus helianthi TaxID=1349432 RepID=A0ABX3EF38_9BACL|nr:MULTISPECIES: 2,3-diaminopropionate biosynthesis protein SbnB [Paenibacillus]OKP79491.1 2,3-diaminopropionate biosynthesis protein SbnB [Paenibacillus helianthi]OKP94765.1 2,3-diaminopropionate biosynthesis protein SbnB [Paenibacillus sp. P32E]